MKKKLFVILSVIFTIAELVILSLYYAYNIFGVKQNFDSFKILFFSIVLIFIQSFFNYKNWTISNVIVRVAFFFTLVADFFMTYLDAYYEVSISFFFLVQLSYFILINYLNKNKYLNPMVMLYLIIIGTLFLIGIKFELLNLLSILSIIYISLSAVNIIYLLILRHKDRYYICFLVGLVLFLLCDICIGIMNLTYDNYPLSDFFDKWIWIFYGPSQIVLVNTLLNVNKMEKISYEKSIKS